MTSAPQSTQSMQLNLHPCITPSTLHSYHSVLAVVKALFIRISAPNKDVRKSRFIMAKTEQETVISKAPSTAYLFLP